MCVDVCVAWEHRHLLILVLWGVAPFPCLDYVQSGSIFCLFLVLFLLLFFSSHEFLYLSTVLSQRPDSEPVPAIDIIRHYLPDVVVFIFTLVTMVTTLVASDKPKISAREGNRTEHEGEGEGEEVAEARNEPTAAAPGVHRAEASDAARPDVRSHSPEAASPDVHVATSPDVQRLNASYVQVPPIVARCLDLGIFVMLGACSVTVPSLTSFVYFAIFLIKATLWAVHLDGWNRRLFVRLLLLVYAGCHLVVVYLYQFEVAQKLIPLQPANTTTSLVARWGRRGGEGEQEEGT